MQFLTFEFRILQVSKDRGEELAIEYGIKFMETSAKASINVEEAFFTLARDIKCKMEKRLVSSQLSKAQALGLRSGHRYSSGLFFKESVHQLQLKF